VAAQGSAYMRFRRALDGGNVTEALSAASELRFVSLAEALELTLLLADREPEKYERAAARWHLRFAQEVPHDDLRESQAVPALLVPPRRTASPLRPWPGSSAGDDRASESPRLLSAGRGRRVGRGAGLATLLSPRGEGRVSRRRLAGCARLPY
jgi:hypothetical protein